MIKSESKDMYNVYFKQMLLFWTFFTSKNPAEN